VWQAPALTLNYSAKEVILQALFAGPCYSTVAIAPNNLTIRIILGMNSKMRRLFVTSICLFLSSPVLALSVDESSDSSQSKHSVININTWEKQSHQTQQARKKSAAKQQNPKLRVISGAALVIDQSDGSLIYAKNIKARQPIASITKLMTAMVVLDQNLSLDEKITIADEDIDRVKFSVSRLSVGSELSRFELLQLALMSSENRAASALGRTAPGGMNAFIDAMNRKAAELGMKDTVFDDPTGLSEKNVSTALDLAKLVNAAYEYELIRQVSTATSYVVETDHYRGLQFRNSNVLVRNKNWEIGLSKTGFIREAGHCLVMQTQIATRNLIIVLLDAQGKMTRIGDANRIKNWLETQKLDRQRVS
jgi:D-alanyl-D-alanine endopeptidase (penicillin-binding protein 7)